MCINLVYYIVVWTYQSASMEAHNYRPFSMEQGLRHQKVGTNSMVLDLFEVCLDQVEAGQFVIGHLQSNVSWMCIRKVAQYRKVVE